MKKVPLLHSLIIFLMTLMFPFLLERVYGLVVNILYLILFHKPLCLIPSIFFSSALSSMSTSQCVKRHFYILIGKEEERRELEKNMM